MFTYMFSEIIFKKDNYKDYEILGSEINNHLKNLGRINILIGQNNSGKSRFLRTLFSDNDFDFLLRNHDISNLRNLIGQKHLQIRKALDAIYMNDADEIFSKINKIKNELIYFNANTTKSLVSNLYQLAQDYISKERFTGWTRHENMISTRTPDEIIPTINKIGEKLQSAIQSVFPSNFNFEINKIYVPILRGLRPIQIEPDINHKFQNNYDNYKLRTLKDYFDLKSEKVHNEIFTGLNLYEDTKKSLLGRKEERDKIKSFEEFLSSTFFNSSPVSLIPDINNDVLLIGIGSDERPVYDLGDGIQSIIIMLYPLFFNQDKNLLVFIEEPENFLHPGMQRIFIEALMRIEFKNYQYFISTHSNHFLDITLDLRDISVYTFKRVVAEDNDGSCTVIENTNNENIRVLDLIGVRNSSIFLSNCTIWVEGITDRLYLRKYVDVYQDYLLTIGSIKKKLREDIHYSFIEYGGSNITHYSFSENEAFDKIKASRLSNRVFLIADSDNADVDIKNAKAERLKNLKKNLGKHFFQINGKEIENLLSEQILVSTISKIEKISPDKLLYERNRLLFKNYQKDGLGNFIQNTFKGLKRTYKEKSGTIKNKLLFCQSAIESIKTFDDLSKPAQQLTKTVFDFIVLNNK